MKKEELNVLIEKHTTDGILNVEELNKDINTALDAVITKKVETALNGASGEVKAAGVAEFLKKHEFESEDGFKVFVKNAKEGESELSQKATRLETENGKKDARIRELEGKEKSLAETNTQMSRQHYALTSKELNIAPEFVEFVVEKVSKSLGEGEDFKEALAGFMEKNPQYGTPGERGNIGEPVGRGNPTLKNPWAKETRNVAEQTRLFRENPAKARELAKQAGIKI